MGKDRRGLDIIGLVSVPARGRGLNATNRRGGKGKFTGIGSAMEKALNRRHAGLK